MMDEPLALLAEAFGQEPQVWTDSVAEPFLPALSTTHVPPDVIQTDAAIGSSDEVTIVPTAAFWLTRDSQPT